MNKKNLTYEQIEERRRQLNFQQIVRDSFAFLEENFKFKCVYSDIYCVKFISEKVYCNIYHEKLSYELGVRIGLLPEHIDNKRYIDIEEIIREQKIDSFIRQNYSALAIRSIEKYIKEASIILKRYGVKSLLGDEGYYLFILKERDKLTKEFLYQERLKQAENKAKEAWDNNDFEKVIEIYLGLSNLNNIQKKKLNIAKDKLGNNMK